MLLNMDSYGCSEMQNVSHLQKGGRVEPQHFPQKQIQTLELLTCSIDRCDSSL